jgi:hypothetical protein
MSIRTRLQHLERLRRHNQPPEPELSKAERWLELLRVFERFMREHAPDRLDHHQQAIALLAEYVSSGRVNAHIEYFCGNCLGDAAAWHFKLPHGGRLAFLEEGHLAQLQEARQIGQWR